MIACDFLVFALDERFELCSRNIVGKLLWRGLHQVGRSGVDRAAVVGAVAVEAPDVLLHVPDGVFIREGVIVAVLGGLEKGGRPTSEFPSHFLNHSVRKEATGGACRVIYHAHPANLIAMTYILPLTARDFTRALWKSATECPVVFPGGVGVLPWMVCGGAEIAKATSELMKQYDVAIWAFHGTFASGESFDTTFGLMHCVEKAADIYMRVQAAGGAKQTMQTQNFIDIAALFGLTLPEKFLKD